MYGTLYVCATPIGNMEDITLRVLRMLKEVSTIAAEDTRRTVQLLNAYDIKTPLTSYHEHNKQTKGVYLLDKLKSGESIALVSDAGMPGISDPGEDLIRLCHENGVPVTVCPGATAGVSALVLSGLATRRYVFEGFLPHNKKEKAEILLSLKDEMRTVIFYEAPHRLLETLATLQKALGERNVATVREITKKFEQINKGSFEELITHFTENEPRGEFVIIIEGTDENDLKQKKLDDWLSLTIEQHMEVYLSQGQDEKSAMKQVAKDRNISKREIYAALKNKTTTL